MRYGPTFLSKMFLEFNDKTINIIDSQYLVYNHHNNNQNFMIQVKYLIGSKIKNINFLSNLVQ